jgi:hypothetical protein
VGMYSIVKQGRKCEGAAGGAYPLTAGHRPCLSTRPCDDETKEGRRVIFWFGGNKTNPVQVREQREARRTKKTEKRNQDEEEAQQLPCRLVC